MILHHGHHQGVTIRRFQKSTTAKSRTPSMKRLPDCSPRVTTFAPEPWVDVRGKSLKLIYSGGIRLPASSSFGGTSAFTTSVTRSGSGKWTRPSSSPAPCWMKTNLARRAFSIHDSNGRKFTRSKACSAIVIVTNSPMSPFD